MSQKSLSIIVLSLLAAFAVLGAFSLAAPAGLVSTAASGCPSSNTVTWVTEPIPQSLNYLAPTGDSTFMVGSLSYMSLAPFPLEPNGSLYWADSAANWITANSNYTQWTFHITPGLTWSNGTAVNASDIADWLTPTYALNPQYDFVGLHTEVTGVHIVNSDTATVILNQSDAQLPNRIGTYYYAPMVSPSAIAQGPAAPLFGTAVGDGPWIYENYTSGSTQMVMVPNPYWPGVKPTACEIQVNFVENSAQIIPFLVAGTADFGGPLAYGNLAALSGLSNIHLNTNGGAFGSFMMYNITHYPYNMTQFRQALAYSINTSAMMQQSIFGYGSPANYAQGGMPTTYGSYTPNQHTYPYNVSEAMNLLHSIGFTGGGAPGVPLLFPNGTKYSVTLYTDSSKAWDPSLELQVATYLTNLGIGVQTQTLTSQNLGADYASNAFNIQNNLVIYSSGGAQYFSPWVSAQQDCNVYGTPGCYNWFAQNAPDGLPHEEWPPFADAWYQSNLTAINNTPATNITGQIHLLQNIQQIRAEYLPVIMLGYPQKVFAYNTQKWGNWPSYYMSNEGQMNESMFGSLLPASQITTSTSATSFSSSTSSSISSSSSTSQTSSQTSTSLTSQSSSTTSSTTSSKSSSSVAMSWSIIAVLLAIVLAAGALLMVRRDPVSRNRKK